MAIVCFHCGGVHRCDCITCGMDTQKGRLSGACVACAGAALNAKHAAVIAKYDPRVRANWSHHPAHDGNPVRRIYLPLEGLK